MGTKNPLDVNNISIGTSGIPTEAGVSVRSSTVTNDSDSYMSLISNTKLASKIARYNTGYPYPIDYIPIVSDQLLNGYIIHSEVIGSLCYGS